MELTTTYIISQVLTVIAYIFIGATYQVKKRKAILILNVLSQIGFGIAYILLQAWSGLAMTVVALIRNFIFIIDENKNGKRSNIGKTDITILVIVLLICILSAIFTYDGFLSILPIIATMLYTYAICQKNVKIYKLLGIPIETLWILYNIYIMSIVAIILETIMLLNCIIGYLREIKEKR